MLIDKTYEVTENQTTKVKKLTGYHPKSMFFDKNVGYYMILQHGKFYTEDGREHTYESLPKEYKLAVKNLSPATRKELEFNLPDDVVTVIPPAPLAEKEKDNLKNDIKKLKEELAKFQMEAFKEKKMQPDKVKHKFEKTIKGG